MLLQRQFAARPDRDLLDLEAAALDQSLVMPPGAVHAAVLGRLLQARGAQLLDQFLHILGVVPAHRQHRVVGHHQHGVLQADDAGQDTFAAHVAVPGADHVHGTLGGVALRVLGRDLPQRVPTADIGPAQRGRHHRGIGGALHHRIVDRNRGRRHEGCSVQPHEVEVAAGLGHRGAHRRRHCGRELLHLAQQGVGAGDEHATVPQMPAALDEALCRSRIGLFDEAAQRQHARRTLQGAARLDVAKARLRSGRPHAECDDPPHLGRHYRQRQRRMQGWHVGDRSVGRHDPQHRAWALLLGQHGGGGDGGGAVAAGRFQQNTRAFDMRRTQLLRRHEAMRLVAHHDGRREVGPLRPQRGGRQHGLAAGQRPELLRIGLARERPEPAAGAAGEDDRDDGGGRHGAAGIPVRGHAISAAFGGRLEGLRCRGRCR